MRRILIITFFTIIATYKLSAQIVGYGPKFGVNISNLSEENINAIGSYYVGGFIEYDFTASWSGEISLIYSQQGGNVTDIPTLSEGLTDIRIKLMYINIPIVAKYYPWQGLNVYGGPQISLLVGAHERVEKSAYYSVFSQWRKSDVGFVVGVGYSWEVGFMVSAQFNYGLLNIYKPVINNIKNITFQIGVGWRF